MAVNWNDFTPIEPQKAKSKAVDWSQFEPITEPTAEERANVRRGLNPDGTRLLPGAGSERTQARLQADSRPVTDEMVPTEVLEPRGAGTYIADRLVASGKTSLKGLGGLVKQANVDYGTGLGAADLAVGVGANILGRLGSDSAKELSNKLNAQAKPISDYGTSVADTLDSYVQDAEDYASPQEKAGDRALSEAKGVLGKLAYVAKNPSVIPEQFLNSIGYMAAGAGAGGAAAGLGAGAAVGANLGTQALLSASSSADGARDIIDQLPDEEISQFPEYQELLNEYDAPTARKILRQRAGDQSFATGIIANAALFGLTAKLPTLERIMHGETGSSASRSINAMRTLLGEAGQEGLQGGAEQFATNVGTSSADNRVGLLDDVPEAAFMEAITTAPAAVTAGAVQPVAQRRKAEELKALREVAETPEQVGTLDAGIALAEARAGQAEKTGYYAQKRAENARKADAVTNPVQDNNVQPTPVAELGNSERTQSTAEVSVGSGAGSNAVGPRSTANVTAEQLANDRDALDEAELDRLLSGAFPDSVEQDVSQTDVDGQDAPILASRNEEDVPDANGIEAEELSDAEAERQWIEATEGESDTLTEGMRALAKNPRLFQTPLYKGQSASDVVSNMPEGFSYGGSEVSNDSMTGESALATKVDVTQRFTNDDGSERVEVHPAYIYESPTRTWIEISELKPGGGGADQVYSAAHSLALNTGKKFKEDPDGLSEMAIIARPKHEASGIMKADSSRAIETGPFLARDSSQFGGTKNRPVALNPNPRVNDDLRERLLTIRANATLAVPEVKGIRYDVDSNQFRRGDGSVVTDSDFRGLARTRRANPVREAMVRDRKNPEDKYASPIGHDSLKVAALIETLRATTDPGARSDLVAKLRVLAETSTDLGILSGILPSRRTEDGRLPNAERNGRMDAASAGLVLSRGQSGAITPIAIRDNLTKRYGRRVKRLLDSGRTKIVQSRDEIPANIQAQLKAVDSVGSGTIQGFYHSATGNTYIIADTIKSLDEVGPLLLHEEGVHAGMKGMLGDKFPSIARRLKSIARNGTEAEKSIVQKAQKRVDRAGTPEQHADEELVAYTVQLAEAQALPSGRLKQWLEDVYAAIKLWAANKGLVNLSVNDIRLIARGALGHRARLDGEAVAPAKKAGPFYSALAESVTEAKGAPKRGTAKQWKEWLDGAQRRGEFKQAERDWLGVDAWLDERETTTKAEIQDFVRENQVQVQETVLQEGGLTLDQIAKRKGFGGWSSYLTPEQEAEVNEAFDAQSVRPGDKPKFASYQLPGGSNYRELLITLPDGKAERRAEIGKEIERLNALRITADTTEDSRLLDQIQPLYDEMNRGATGYRSSHFEQPNILAHVRFNERTDADGKRVLFVEEVQSDWHQAGRKQGYHQIAHEYQIEPNPSRGTWDVLDHNGSRLASYGSREEAQRVADSSKKQTTGVPDAPLKKEWPLTAMKRVIRHAAENGFDRVAWTTGEQQAARYDLSKQIASVNYREPVDGKYKVTIIGLDGYVIGIKDEPLTLDQIEEMVGKEIAKKVEVGDGENHMDFKRISGDGLKVGGEGMKAFYDKMLPNEVGKYVKKWGGKVGATQIDAEAISTTSGGDEARAARLRRTLKGESVSTTSVHSLDITDAMRESVMEGQPLFAKKDTITVDGKERSRLNSDGKPIAGDYEALTNFWRWFGDSKVTDEQGRPLTVYHGTKADITEFSKKREGIGSTMFGSYEVERHGIFVTPDPVLASAFAMQGGKKLEARTMPLYAAVQNPLDMTSGYTDKIFNSIEKWANEKELNGYRVARNIGDMWNDWALFDKDGGQDPEFLIGMLNDLGYDGAKIYEPPVEGDGPSGETYVAFNPSQIKSATGNRGTFSPSDDSILASRVTPQDRIDEARRVASDKRTEASASLGVTGPSLTWELDEGRFEEGIKGSFNRLREQLQDKYLSVLGAQGDIEAVTGKLIEESQNVYRRENLMHGRVAEFLRQLKDRRVNPIKRAMKDQGVSLEALEDFMEARAAPSRNRYIATINPDMPDGGSGMTTAEAKAFMAGKSEGLRSKESLTPEMRKKIEGIVSRIDGVRNETRTRLLESGQITQEQYDQIKANDSYAPLRDSKGNDIGVPQGYSGKGLDVRGKPIQQALGRGTGNRAENILANVFGDAEKSIIEAERTRVGQTLLRLVLANPNKDVWEAEPIIIERKFSEAKQLVYDAVKAVDNDPGAVRVMVKGKPYRIVLKDQRMAAAIKNLGAEQINAVFRFLGAINRYFSAILTRYNPSFVPINMIRDLGMGIVGITSEHGLRAGKDAVSSYLPAMRALWREARGKPSSGQTGVYVKEFTDAGGRTGFHSYQNVEEITNQIRGELKSMMQIIRDKDETALNKLARVYSKGATGLKENAIIQVIEDANDTIENSMRLAAFIARRKKGHSIESAAEYAKNVTVNFNRRGHATSVFNSMFLFFNAATQGSVRTFQLLKQKKVMGVMAGLASLQFVLAAMAMGDEDDDGLTAWEKIPDYEKERNLIFPVVGEENGKMKVKLFKLPMPYGFNFFPYMGGRLAQAMNSRGPKDTWKLSNDLGAAAIDSVSPVKFTGGTRGYLPYLANIFVSLGYNKNDFGSRISDERPYSAYEVPRASLGRASTPEIYHKAAGALNRLGGGDEVTPPKIMANLLDWSPEDLKYLTEAFTGGIGRTINQSVDAGQKAYAGLDLSTSDIPVLKSIIADVNMERATQGTYYERKELIARESDRVRAIYSEKGKETALEYMRETPALSGMSLHRFKTGKFENKNGHIQLEAKKSGLFSEYKKAEKEVSDISAELKAARTKEWPSLRDKLERIDALEKQREAAQRKLNVKWKESQDG